MALSDIIKKLQEDMEQEIKLISEKAETKMQDLKKSFEQEMKEIEKEIDQKMEAKKKDINRKMETMLSMEDRIITLNAKQEICSKAYAQAIEKLITMKDSDYESFLIKLLKSVPLDKGSLTPAKGKSQATKKAVEQAKKTFSVGKEGDFEGGFKIELNNVAIDLSFKTLLKQLREKTEPDVAHLLFSE